MPRQAQSCRNGHRSVAGGRSRALRRFFSFILALTVLGAGCIVPCGCEGTVVGPPSGAAGAPGVPVSPVKDARPTQGPVPEPARIVILAGPDQAVSSFGLAPGGPVFAALVACYARLAGEATAVTLDATEEIVAEHAGGAFQPGVAGVLLVFDRPVDVSLTSPLDARLREYQPNAWMSFTAKRTAEVFIPYPAWCDRQLTGNLYVRNNGDWLAPRGELSVSGGDPRWAAMWSQPAAALAPNWLERILARYLRPDDLRPGWPLPPPFCSHLASPGPTPGQDPIWHKPAAARLPLPSVLIVYGAGGPNGSERLELSPQDPRAVRILRILERTLNSTIVGRSTTFELPTGLSGTGPVPDWPGVLLVYDHPVAIRSRTPVDPPVAFDRVVAWGETVTGEVVRAYFPAQLPGGEPPSLEAAAYLLRQPAPAAPPVWQIGFGGGDAAQQAELGKVLANLGR